MYDITLLINGGKKIVITPKANNKVAKDLMEIFGKDTEYRVKFLDESAQILGTPCSGSLVLEEIKKEKQ